MFIFLYLLRRKYRFARPPRSRSPKTWLRSRAEDMIANGYREWTILPLSHPPEPQQPRRLRRPQRLRPFRARGPDMETGGAQRSTSYPDHQDELVDLGFYSGDTINQVQRGKDQLPQPKEQIPDQLPVLQRPPELAVNMFHRASQQLGQHFAGQGSVCSPSLGLRRSNAVRRSWSVRNLFGRHRNQEPDEESSVQHHDPAQNSALSTAEDRMGLPSSVVGTPAAGSVDGPGTELSTLTTVRSGGGLQPSLSARNGQDLLGMSETLAEASNGSVSSLSRTASGSAASISSLGSIIVATASVGHMTSAMAAICVNLYSSQRPQMHMPWERSALQDKSNDADKSLLLPQDTATSRALGVEELKDEIILQRPKAVYTDHLSRTRTSAKSSLMTATSVESIVAAESSTSSGTSSDSSGHATGQFQRQSTRGLSPPDQASKLLEQTQTPRWPAEIHDPTTMNRPFPLSRPEETTLQTGSALRLSEQARPAEAHCPRSEPAEDAPPESRTSSPRSDAVDLPYSYPQISGYLDPSRATDGPLVVRNADTEASDKGT